MAAPLIPLALGAGALWLLSQLQNAGASPGAAGSNTPPPPPPGGATPVATNTGVNTGAVATAATTTGIGLVASIGAPLAVKGIIAASSATSTATSAGADAAEAAEVGIDAGLIGIDVGAQVIGALYITFIIAVIVTDQVVGAIQAYKSQVEQLLGYDVQADSPVALSHVYRVRAENVAISLLQTALLNNPQVNLKYGSLLSGIPGTYLVDTTGQMVPIASIAQIVQTCIYLGIVQQQAYDDAATLFWTFHGDNLSQQQTRGESLNTAFGPFFTQPMLAGNPFDYPPSFQDGRYLSIPLISNMPQTRLTADGKPLTLAGIQAVAMQELGSSYATVVARMQAIGASQAVTMAAIAGYSFNWPGEPLFAQTIGANTVPTWSGAQRTLPAVTGATSTTQINDWWLTDPVTGISVAPDSSRSLTQFVMSIPPTGQLQGYGRYSGYGRGTSGKGGNVGFRVRSGRRLRGYGVVDPSQPAVPVGVSSTLYADKIFNNPALPSQTGATATIISAGLVAQQQQQAQAIAAQNLASSIGGNLPLLLGVGGAAAIFFMMRGGKK